MTLYDPKNIRNVGLFSHQGAGKTSLADAFLFNGKVTTRLCKVDEENSNFDFEPEEINRRATLSLSIGFFEWKKCLFNVIDTPGDSNFLAETKSCLPAINGGIVVISAVDGIQVGTEKVLTYLSEWSLPVIIFLNKMDRERVDFYNALEEIQKTIGSCVVPFTIPIGKEENFEGVVNLISMKGCYYAKDEKGLLKEGDIPDELKEITKKYREILIEKIAEQDEKLIESYFEKGDLSPEEIKIGLEKGLVENKIFPLFAGSANRNMGLDQILNFMVDYFPSPLSKNNVNIKDFHSGKTSLLNISKDAPFTGYIFKTIVDPYAGKLSVFRVFCGSIQSDSSFYNATTKEKERYGQIFKLQGKKQVPVGTAITGDIVAVSKLKDAKTSHTLLGEEGSKIIVPPQMSSRSIAFAIKPKTQSDEDKLTSAVQKLMEEDIGIELGRDEQAKEFLLYGLGQTHIEVSVERLKRKYGVDVELRTPKVPYKETIKSVAKNVEGKHKKQSGGRGQFGICYIDIEPMPRGSGYEFINDIFGGSIPRQYIPAVEKGIKEAMARGIIAGYPVVDVRVRLFDGKYHEVDSDNRSFEIAASKAFKQAFKNAKPILLEPIMNMEIIVPEDNTGDVIGNINSKRGRVMDVSSHGRNSVIKAQTPLSEILMYASDLKSITSGRGSFTMEFSHYEEVPAFIAEKIISTVKIEEEE